MHVGHVNVPVDQPQLDLVDPVEDVSPYSISRRRDARSSPFQKNPAGVTLKCYFLSFCRMVLYEQEDWVAKHQIPSSTYKIQVIGMHLTEFAAAKNVIASFIKTPRIYIFVSQLLQKLRGRWSRTRRARPRAARTAAAEASGEPREGPGP